MNDRHQQIIDRAKQALLDDGLVDTPVYDKSPDGMGDYSSFFEMMVDRKLEAQREPTAQEVWVDMKRQLNYASKTIADAEKEYKKLFNANFDLQREYDQLLKGRPDERT